MNAMLAYIILHHKINMKFTESKLMTLSINTIYTDTTHTRTHTHTTHTRFSKLYLFEQMKMVSLQVLTGSKCTPFQYTPLMKSEQICHDVMVRMASI
jgi:hypothetical protein